MLLGIDIGGTTIGLGLVDNGRIISQTSVDSFAADATLGETLSYLADRVAEAMVPGVTAIGVGVPTLVDPAKGIVYDAANIPSWTEVHLGEFLQERFGVPARVNNDSNCFALGAYSRLEEPTPLMVGITLGTGTGMGIVSEGRLLCGVNCGAGEVGSLPYMGADYETFCSKKFFSARGLVPKDVADGCAAGDGSSLRLMEEFGEHLGHLLATVRYTYDPGVIVIGGGLSRSFRHFGEAMLASMRRNFVYTRYDNLKVLPMSEDGIALLGAALL